MDILIHIILGSTRKGRQGERVAKWVHAVAAQRTDLRAELLDLREWPLPFYDEAESPTATEGQYASDLPKRWSAKIAEADGYLFVTPEYNHGYPAVLKNALDYLYAEWNNKPCAFVSYSGGPVSGARAVEQLRQVVIELQMAPVRAALHLPLVGQQFDDQGQLKDPSHEGKLGKVLDQLLWWARALKVARAAPP